MNGRDVADCSTAKFFQEQSIGGVRPNARENGQISPSTNVRAASRLHPASVLQKGRKSANIHACRRRQWVGRWQNILSRTPRPLPSSCSWVYHRRARGPRVLPDEVPKGNPSKQLSSGPRKILQGKTYDDILLRSFDDQYRPRDQTHK
jgi:hypothetical protein